MIVMVIIGAVLSIVGLGGILWCIRKAGWLKRTELDDNQTRAEINKLVFAHMAAIFAAFMGLGLLITGLLLS